jgi:hypothetical protein
MILITEGQFEYIADLLFPTAMNIDMDIQEEPYHYKAEAYFDEESHIKTLLYKNGGFTLIQPHKPAEDVTEKAISLATDAGIFEDYGEDEEE